MKTWNIQRTQFKVSDFVNWYRSNELELSPIFQRRSVWPTGAKSFLIDTVMRGLPIPAVILQENCLRCHEAITHGIAAGASLAADEMRCTHCHRAVGHGEQAGLGGPFRDDEIPEEIR